MKIAFLLVTTLLADATGYGVASHGGVSSTLFLDTCMHAFITHAHFFTFFNTRCMVNSLECNKASLNQVELEEIEDADPNKLPQTKTTAERALLQHPLGYCSFDVPATVEFFSGITSISSFPHRRYLSSQDERLIREYISFGEAYGFSYVLRHFFTKKGRQMSFPARSTVV
jgi:hypothetical protein